MVSRSIHEDAGFMREYDDEPVEYGHFYFFNLKSLPKWLDFGGCLKWWETNSHGLRPTIHFLIFLWPCWGIAYFLDKPRWWFNQQADA